VGRDFALYKLSRNSKIMRSYLAFCLPKIHPFIEEINLRTPVYGLTGGIASGKSTALRQFVSLGVDTLDTDQLARDVVARGTPGAKTLEDTIGSQYFSAGLLNRAMLRANMYKSPVLKKNIEGVIHPLVLDAVKDWLNQRPLSPYRILCSPLLIETNQHEILDGVIVIDAPESEQLSRGSNRDIRSINTIQHIIDAQLPRDTRLSHATYVIDNSGDLESLTWQIQTLHERLSND
jgi:dephospho-CoA kinase